MQIQYCAAHKNRANQRGARLLFRGRALDKALDTWYNTGVGLKKTHKTGAMNDNN
jgi:hypothetical protein